MVLFVRDLAGEVRPSPAARRIEARQYLQYLEVQDVMGAARATAAAIEASQQQAYEAACARGYEDGMQQAQVVASERMVVNVAHAIAYYSGVEQCIVDLVLQAMQRLCAEYSARDRVEVVVRAALEKVRQQKHITLRVAPGQVLLLNAMRAGLLEEFPGIQCIDVCADDSLQLDACVLETEIGIVETSLQGQIAALRAAFQQVFGTRRPDGASI